jgi:hypothetical protein
MRTLGALLMLVLIGIYFTSCKDDTVNATTIDFSKYTLTDEAGALISEADTTDWNNDLVWTKGEEALVGFNDTVIVRDSTAGKVQVSPAFPNPNNGRFNLLVTTERECKMHYAFVDDKLQVLSYGARKFTTEPAQMAFDFSNATAFDKNETYRIYYAFYIVGDSLIYKGHGDIRIE